MKKHLGTDYEHMFHAVPGNYLVMMADTPDFTIIDASEAYCRLTMLKREDIIGKKLFDVFPDAPRKQNTKGQATLVDSLTKCIKTGKSDYQGIIRYDIKTTNGFKVKYWETTNYPVRNMDGKVTGALLSTEDVTERVLAEEQLELAQVQKDETLSLGAIGSWSWQVDDDKVYVDKATAHMFGLSEETGSAGLPLQAFLDHIHLDDRARVVDSIKHASTNNTLYEEEFRVRDISTKLWRWVAVRGKNTPTQAANRFSGIMIDITERKDFENQLVESEQRFRSLADAMPQMVWVANEEGNLLFFNQRWHEYTGMSKENINEDWIQSVHPEDRDATSKAWKKSVTSGTKYETEYRLQNAATSEYRWFVGRALPYKDTAGKGQTWYGTSTDIHDQKIEAEHLEHVVAERTKELQAKNNELQSFAYVASHDLQEPLRKIQAFGNLLELEYKEKLGEGGDYLTRMKAAAARMSVLIEDLLAFSRVTTKDQSTKTVSLSETVREVIEDLESRINETGAKLHIGKLPDIMADPTHIRQLFQNLIANALKFQKKGVKPDVKVRLTKSPNSKFVRIEVADNGIGFDEKYLDKIFSVFQRLHGRDEYQGTGIGLAICRKIAERYGGTITARSTPGNGATFYIDLPKKIVKKEKKA